MIKLILKVSLLTLFATCAVLVVKAQIGYDFSRYDIGTSVGINQVYGDAETQTLTPSIHFNLTYNQTPYINFILEAQLGVFKGGDSLTTRLGRQFTNDFSAYVLRGQLQLGEFLDYSTSPGANALKNLYFSTGVGYLVNHITQITRYSLTRPGLYTGGENYSQVPFIPLKIGYEFKLFNKYQQPSFKVDIGYQYNYVFGDNVDGYTYGRNNDIYTQFTVGVKFAIGGDIISSKKQIHY